jgi:predicted nucleic acid-binding protein
MIYFLDTSTISHLVRGERRAVAARFVAEIHKLDVCYPWLQMGEADVR